jgi:hypothetical protein
LFFIILLQKSRYFKYNSSFLLFFIATAFIGKGTALTSASAATARFSGFFIVYHLANYQHNRQNEQKQD